MQSILKNRKGKDISENDIMLEVNSTDLDTNCKLLERPLASLPREHHADSCLSEYDGVLCWPETPPGTLAIQPCLEQLNGIRYDTTQNATKRCLENGTWDPYTNYTSCRELPSLEESDATTTIYFVGFTISFVALVAAVFIFWKFKDLRCLRNTIHMNLMCTYILYDFMWIFIYTLLIKFHTNPVTCITFILLLHYFHLTNFFWMLVEGLYLYILVVKTFTGENFKLRVYTILGWGVPAVFISLWGIAKSFTVPSTQEVEDVMKNWLWTPHPVDWIFQSAALAVLLINTLFLITIMWVLITKLRSANNVETQQYRKATKALLVLIPLLGMTYILVIVGPTEGISKDIYDNLRAVLLSTQGFTVALFYCFLNAEVRNTVRHHYSSWHTRRTIGSRRTRYSSRDWSPQGRDCKRLYQKRIYHQKRGSTCSDGTTTTVVTVQYPKTQTSLLTSSEHS